MTSPALIGAGVGVGLILASVVPDGQPLLVWNASPSQPIGLYRRLAGAAHVSDRVLVRLPPHFADLAARRGYLAPSAYLIKPVVAVGGDRVCRLGTRIFLRGRIAARAAVRDGLRRALPTWQGCRGLRMGELFLLAADPDSFDSRYFGAVSGAAVMGRAALVWSLERGNL
jgi:conjugative transfer signal peptidase TraF